MARCQTLTEIVYANDEPVPSRTLEERLSPVSMLAPCVPYQSVCSAPAEDGIESKY